MAPELLTLAGITLVAATINGALGYGFSSITVPLALFFFTNRVLNPVRQAKRHDPAGRFAAILRGGVGTGVDARGTGQRLRRFGKQCERPGDSPRARPAPG